MSKRIPFRLSGIADEAGPDIRTQISAIRDLGWKDIEIRNVDHVNVGDMDDAAFDRMAGVIADHGLRVCALGSRIANWERTVRSPFEDDLVTARRLADRAARLGVPYVRIMSYAIDPERSPDEQDLPERLQRLREIVAIFAGADVQALHENCFNYGGLGWPFTLRLLEGVPGLALLFDTANPSISPDLSREGPPYRRQSSWDFFTQARPYIRHVHIKDNIADGSVPDGLAFQKARYTWPGEGQSAIARIVTTLIADGFSGAVSIEPHLARIFHESERPGVSGARATFVEYGKRLTALLA